MSTKVEPITSYLEPKPTGGIRVMATLAPKDSRRWEQLGREVAASIEPRLNKAVLANRTYRDAGDRSSLVPTLRRAQLEARKLAGRSEVVIRTDVRSFYPSVTPSIAFRSLRGMGVDREVASAAARMLDGWGSEDYPGLPIGPPASAILGNALLAPVDEQMARFPFLRWVDDFAIGTHEGHVSEVLDRFDAALEGQGLYRSTAKTGIHQGPRAFRWLGTYVGGRTSE